MLTITDEAQYQADYEMMLARIDALEARALSRWTDAAIDFARDTRAITQAEAIVLHARRIAVLGG